MKSVAAFFSCVGFAAAVAVVPGCSCNNGIHHPDGGGGSGGDGGPPAVGSITIDPSDVTLDLVQGQPAPTQAFTVTFHPASGDKDVTNDAMYALTDLTFGSMNQNVFTAGTDHGGTTQLVASYTPAGGSLTMAIATIHVRVHGAFQGPDCMGS